MSLVCSRKSWVAGQSTEWLEGSTLVLMTQQRGDGVHHWICELCTAVAGAGAGGRLRGEGEDGRWEGEGRRVSGQS